MLLQRTLRAALGLTLILAGVANSLAQSLREQADKSGMLIGAAVNPSRFAEAPYAATLAREFNMVEPENTMKWTALRPNRETFNFKPGDQVVEFAKAHSMKVRGHCLLWHNHNSGWLASGNFTADELSRMLR